MYGQNNNYNSQFGYNSNNSNSSNQPVKNKFFNQDLFADEMMDDVGASSVNNQVNNRMISWGVGGNNQNNHTSSFVDASSFKDSDMPSINPDNYNNETLDVYSNEILEEVNGDVYGSLEPEVLDGLDAPVVSKPKFFDMGAESEVLEENEPINNNAYGNINPPTDNLNNIFGVDMSSRSTEVAPVKQPSFDQNAAMNDAPMQQMVMNDDLMAHQPLSYGALGTTSIEEKDLPNEIEENSKFFPNPDNFNNNSFNQNNQFNNNQMNNNPMVNNQVSFPQSALIDVDELDGPKIVIDDVALVKAYVGKKYEKINMSSFSAGFFFFGTMYLFYRKMNLIGILLFLFNIAITVTFITKPYISLIIIAIVHLIMCLSFRSMYLSTAKRKTQKIKKKHPGVRQGDLNNLCAKKGGTSLGMALLLQFLLGIVGSGLIVFIIGPAVLIAIFNNLITTNTSKFDGNIVYNETKIRNIFDINFPDGFEKVDDNKYKIVTEGMGQYNTCEVSFGAVNNYVSSTELINEIGKYFESTDKIENVTNNDLEWSTLYLTTDKGEEYYRSTTFNNHIVLFHYLSGKDTPVGVCDTYLVNILDSISKK